MIPVQQESEHENIVVKGEKLRVAEGKPLQNKISPDFSKIVRNFLLELKKVTVSIRLYLCATNAEHAECERDLVIKLHLNKCSFIPYEK